MSRASKIFVGNLTVGTTADELRGVFAQYGEITECDIMGAGNFGFVHMANDLEADNAIRELKGYMLNGSPIKVEKSTSETQGRRKKELASSTKAPVGVHSGIPKRNTTKIFVGNIKDGTTNADLRELFELHGTVSEADVCSGYGFVHMASQSEAIKAIKALNAYYLNGNRLNVELSTEATQGRSSVPHASGVGPSVRGRPITRGRGLLLAPGKRYDPYVIPGSLQRVPAADPYASTSYDSYSYDPYAEPEYDADPYAASDQARASAGAGSLSSDSFARDLLNLYLKNPDAFDKYAKDPLVQKSLNLGEPQEADDPYYRPPKEYYEAKKTSLVPARPSMMETSYTSMLSDSYAPVPKRPLLPIGSGRGMGVMGLPKRAPGAIGATPLIGHMPMAAPMVRPRLAGPRPVLPRANLYTSFE